LTKLHLSREHDGRVALLEFDHGKANEVGSAVLTELEALVDDLERSGGVCAVISFSRRRSSKGTPIFIAGADVSERVGWSDQRVKEHVRWQRLVLARLASAPVLHLAVVDGVALGWGTEFLLTTDYAIAAPGAVFGLPETGLGILPGAGGTSELHARIGPCHALRLGMTGERIGADEAHRIGLVQELAADLDAGLARARALAAMAATRSPTALAAFKLAVLRSQGEAPEVRHELEARAYEWCVDTGEAGIGRARFGGQDRPWGPRRRR
jgi:enoyl-CoA hydratase/carnithine racemase